MSTETGQVSSLATTAPYAAAIFTSLIYTYWYMCFVVVVLTQWYDVVLLLEKLIFWQFLKFLSRNAIFIDAVPLSQT